MANPDLRRLAGAVGAHAGDSSRIVFLFFFARANPSWPTQPINGFRKIPGRSDPNRIVAR